MKYEFKTLSVSEVEKLPTLWDEGWMIGWIANNIFFLQREKKSTRKTTTEIVLVDNNSANIIKEKEEYWNPKINEALAFLKKTVWVDDFKEPEKRKRQIAKHIVQLHERIGSEDFKERLKAILSDSFKAKNCNSLNYLYSEIKSYIHSPVVEQNYSKDKKYNVAPVIF